MRVVTAGAIIIAVLAAIAIRSSVSAQAVKNVRFAKGKYSASYRGHLPREYTDYDAYVFRARRGQTVSFKLTTSDPRAYVFIYETLDEIPPDEDIMPVGKFLRAWSGELPVTSEYSLQVYGVRGIDDPPSRRSPYTIEITIR